MPKIVRLNCHLVNKKGRPINYENIDFEGLKEMFHGNDKNSPNIPTAKGSKENPNITSIIDECNEPIETENPFKTILDRMNNLNLKVNEIYEQLGKLLSDTTKDESKKNDESSSKKLVYTYKYYRGNL